MNIVIIQPNWQAVSEVWMLRMQAYIEKDVKGIAAFLPPGEQISANFELFDLNGRRPNFVERQSIRSKLLRYDQNKTRDKELLDFVKSKKADIVFIHFLSTAEHLGEVLHKLKIPIVIHVHGIDILWDARDFYNSQKDYHHTGYVSNCKKLLGLPNVHVLANSMFSKEQLIKINTNPEKITVKYFGVPPVNIKRDYFKESLKILFLGRLVEFKGPHLVIEAFFNACSQGFKGELIIAGDGPMKPFCEIIVSRSIYKDRVSFLGEVSKEEAGSLFHDADIYTMHSCKSVVTKEVEAFGVSIIEAMSYHLPVIMGNIGGPGEIITNDVDGILVTPGDVESHTAAFMRLFNNRDIARQLGENAAKTINEKFSPENEKDILLSAFSDLIKKNL